MKTVAIIAVVLALLVLLAPVGLEILIILSSLMAAVAFRAAPIIATVAFLINFMMTMVHVPGFVYPADAFHGQVILVHPEIGVHWLLLVIQIIFISIAFFVVLHIGIPEKERASYRSAFHAD